MNLRPPRMNSPRITQLKQSPTTVIPVTSQRHQVTKNHYISSYHVHTAKIIAVTAIYMRLQTPDHCQLNDITIFNLTDEHHRLETFNNQNWRQSPYNVTDLAKNGFFSLSKINTHNPMFFLRNHNYKIPV